MQHDQILCCWERTAGNKFEDFQDQVAADGSGATVDLAPNHPGPQRNHNGLIHGDKRQFRAVQRFLDKVRTGAKKLEARLPQGAMQFFYACSSAAQDHHSVLYTANSHGVAVLTSPFACAVQP
jgi:hypothetical protein